MSGSKQARPSACETRQSEITATELATDEGRSPQPLAEDRPAPVLVKNYSAVHPAADAFPMMSGERYRDLVADIQAHGIREPMIVVHDGTRDLLLDGRNRAAVCRELGIEARYERHQIADPIAYVRSKNLHRRHLDESQRAMAIVGLETLESQARAPTGKFAHRFNPTRDGLAKEASVSARSITAARHVKKTGSPELVQSVIDGVVTVSGAEKVLRSAQKKLAMAPSAVAAVEQPPAAHPPAIPSATSKPPAPPTVSGPMLSTEATRPYASCVPSPHQQANEHVQSLIGLMTQHPELVEWTRQALRSWMDMTTAHDKKPTAPPAPPPSSQCTMAVRALESETTPLFAAVRPSNQPTGDRSKHEHSTTLQPPPRSTSVVIADMPDVPMPPARNGFPLTPPPLLQYASAGGAPDTEVDPFSGMLRLLRDAMARGFDRSLVALLHRRSLTDQDVARAIGELDDGDGVADRFVFLAGELGWIRRSLHDSTTWDADERSIKKGLIAIRDRWAREAGLVEETSEHKLRTRGSDLQAVGRIMATWGKSRAGSQGAS